MKRLVLKPEGWPCTIDECRPGLFVDMTFLSVGLKSEYDNGKAYNEAGEFYYGDKGVQPVTAVWEDDNDD